jgi:hypothetical protein
MLDEKRHIERLEGQSLHHEQVRGRIPAIWLRRKVGQAKLGGRTVRGRRLAPDRASAHDEGELEQLAPNPLGAPQRVLASHPRNQETDFSRLGAAGRAGFAIAPLPANDRLGPDI